MFEEKILNMKMHKRENGVDKAWKLKLRAAGKSFNMP
jgi:hypothetical protein